MPKRISTKVKPEAKTKTGTKDAPKVEVHPALLELIQLEQESAKQAASYMVQICEMIEEENLSNPVIIMTLMKGRGMTEASARSQCSRMRTLLKDQVSLEKLKSGEVTVRASVKSAQTRQAAAGPKNKLKAFDRALAKLVETAKALGQPKETLLITIEAKFDEAKIK